MFDSVFCNGILLYRLYCMYVVYIFACFYAMGLNVFTWAYPRI